MSILRDKVVIITGGASGIGLATVKAALNEGARVLAVDISPQPVLLLAEQPNLHFVQCSVTDPSTGKRVTQTCVEVFGGRVDALFNIAGVMDHNCSVDTLADEDWNRCIAVNLTAPVNLMRGVIPIMRKQQSGSIINVASKAAMSGAVAGVAYTASKHGLVGVTKNVAWRFKGDNIRCNAICPGGTDTAVVRPPDPIRSDSAALQTMEPIHTAIALRENFSLIAPEQLAYSLIFLASDNSSRINGAIIPVDDGWSTI